MMLIALHSRVTHRNQEMMFIKIDTKWMLNRRERGHFIILGLLQQVTFNKIKKFIIIVLVILKSARSELEVSK